MTHALTLCLSQRTFEALHVAADGKGKKASVNKADLSALLIDHARALALLADMHVETREAQSG